MHPARRSRLTVAVAAAALLLVLVVAGPSNGQVVDDLGSTTTSPPDATTTTAPPVTAPSTTKPSAPTTAPPDDPKPPAPADPADPAPGGEGDGAPDGDGAPEGGEGVELPDGAPRTVPADAQAIINSIRRTPANSTQKLHDAVQELVELGLSPQEAIRVGFGRFPIAGVANYSHDWYFPRWGPGFRFHKGTDVFAPFGTPLRAAVDGTVTASTSELGGLSAKVYMADGTYFYYAHLSALVDGFVDGMDVATGDIIGYVGDSGNAKGGTPHLHFGVYPKGGAATDPKPILDGFIADALDQLPSIVERVRAEGDPAALAAGPRTPRSLLATSLLRPLTDRTAAGDVPTEVLYQASGNPSGGGVSVAATHAEQFAASIDWDAASSRAVTQRVVVERTKVLIDLALGPLRTRSGPAQTASP